MKILDMVIEIFFFFFLWRVFLRKVNLIVAVQNKHCLKRFFVSTCCSIKKIQFHTRYCKLWYHRQRKIFYSKIGMILYKQQSTLKNIQLLSYIFYIILGIMILYFCKVFGRHKSRKQNHLANVRSFIFSLTSYWSFDLRYDMIWKRYLFHFMWLYAVNLNALEMHPQWPHISLNTLSLKHIILPNVLFSSYVQ